MQSISILWWCHKNDGGGNFLTIRDSTGLRNGMTFSQTQSVFHQTWMHFSFHCGNIWLRSAHNQTGQSWEVLKNKKKKKKEGMLPERFSGWGLEQLQSVAQSSATLARLFITMSNDNGMKILPTSWQTFHVVLKLWFWLLSRKCFCVVE